MKRYTSNITARPRGSVSSAGSVSQSVSQLFHGPAPRSPLHRLAVRLRHSRSTGSGLVARADVPLGMCVCAFVGRVGCEGMCEGYLCEVCPSDPCPCVRVSRVSRLPPVCSVFVYLQLLASFPPVRGLVFVGSGCGGPGGPGAAPLYSRPLRFPTERGACHDAPGRRPLMRDVIAPDYIRLVWVLI